MLGVISVIKLLMGKYEKQSAGVDPYLFIFFQKPFFSNHHTFKDFKDPLEPFGKCCSYPRMSEPRDEDSTL